MGHFPGQKDGIPTLEMMDLFSYLKRVFPAHNKEDFILLVVDVQGGTTLRIAGVFKDGQSPVCVLTGYFNVVGTVPAQHR